MGTIHRKYDNGLHEVCRQGIPTSSMCTDCMKYADCICAVVRQHVQYVQKNSGQYFILQGKILIEGYM